MPSPHQLNSDAQRAVAELQGADVLAKLIGNDPQFRKVVDQLHAIGRAAATVLLTGETGTGKELAARAVHYLSSRSSHPFVAVNCGGLTDALLQTELFGHEPGAYTDARTRRTGLIDEARGGTLFLDEVESLTAHAQVVLLRLLQDKRFRVLGSSAERQADVRFVAATNVPLETMVESGGFRADLFHRIAVLRACLPPLRERRGDILLLAEHFLTKHSVDGVIPILSVSAQAALLSYHWPGNVRELENAIVRGISLCAFGIIDLAHLGIAHSNELQSPAVMTTKWRPFREMKREFLEAFERDYLTRLMRDHQGNVTRAAHSARKDRRELGKLLKKYAIRSGSNSTQD